MQTRWKFNSLWHVSRWQTSPFQKKTVVPLFQILLLTWPLPRLQETLLRRLDATMVTVTEERQVADHRLAELAHESECLKATIAKQQEQINALLNQKVEVLEDPKPGPQPKVDLQDNQLGKNQEVDAENWTCLHCTFQNIHQLEECEMCGAARASPSKRRKVMASVVEGPLKEMPEGPKEFLRQATKVVEANLMASQECSQEKRQEHEAEIFEVPLDGIWRVCFRFFNFTSYFIVHVFLVFSPFSLRDWFCNPP